jgi:hypothetical protein
VLAIDVEDLSLFFFFLPSLVLAIDVDDLSFFFFFLPSLVLPIDVEDLSFFLFFLPPFVLTEVDDLSFFFFLDFPDFVLDGDAFDFPPDEWCSFSSNSPGKTPPPQISSAGVPGGAYPTKYKMKTKHLNWVG